MFSPDGRLIAYEGGDATHQRAIFIRNLADGTTRALPGSAAGQVPAFSPDSQSIAFVAAGILRAGRIGGGRPEDVSPFSGAPNGLAWLADDTLVVSSQGGRLPLRVAAAGGLLEPVEVRPGDTDELWFMDPVAIPGSESVLVTVARSGTDDSQIAALSLKTGELTRIASGSNARLLGSSTLLFLQRGELVAATFDAVGLALTGPAHSLSPPGTVVLSKDSEAGKLMIGAIHPDGYAVLPMEPDEGQELVWVDRSGQETPTGFQTSGSSHGLGVALSYDNTRVALVAPAAMIVDLADVTRRRVLPRPGTSLSYPRFDRTGEHITVIGNETGTFLSYRIAVGGDTPPEIYTDAPSSIGTDFFPDGRSVIGYVVTAEAGRDLWIFHLDGEDEPLLQTSANERGPMLSPDGGAYAYVSDESGDDRIYLRRFPGSGQAWQLSGDGATEPRWSRDGSEVFFVQNGRMTAVSVDLSAGVRYGEASDLFAVGPYMFDSFGNAMYDVADDGRFMMIRVGRGPRTWRWIENWGTDLDKILDAAE